MTLTSNHVTIAPVVEGHGDAKAVPFLLRRIAHDLGIYELTICPPQRVSRSTLGTEAGLMSAVRQASYRVDGLGGVLVLFDADDDCPVDLVGRLLDPARKACAGKNLGLVVAEKEFESWFLAAAPSLAGRGGLPDNFGYDGNPQAKRDAKGVVDQAMRSGPERHKYSETVDQARLATLFDMEMARRGAPSFDKLWREVEALCRPVPPRP